MKTLLAVLFSCCVALSQHPPLTVQILNANGQVYWQRHDVLRIRYPRQSSHLLVWQDLSGPPIHVVVPPSHWVLWYYWP